MSYSEKPSPKDDCLRFAEQVSALASNDLVRSMFEAGEEAQAEAEALVQRTLAVEHGLCTSLIGSLAWFSDALYQNRSEQRFFPRDWLDPTCGGNPDVVMACVLCQMANYGYAVLELVSRGLDTPARALLRATAELCNMLPVLAVDREAFQSFVIDNESSAKEKWYKLFSSRKIAQRLTHTDHMLGLPQQWTEYMREFREANGEFFSGAVHHSSNSILVGCQPIISGTDRVAFALLGGPPSGSKATLTHLATALNYGLASFIASSFTRPGHAVQCAQPHYWDSGMFIFKAIQPLFLRMLKQRDKEATNKRGCV